MTKLLLSFLAIVLCAVLLYLSHFHQRMQGRSVISQRIDFSGDYAAFIELRSLIMDTDVPEMDREIMTSMTMNPAEISFTGKGVVEVELNCFSSRKREEAMRVSLDQLKQHIKIHPAKFGTITFMGEPAYRSVSYLERMQADLGHNFRYAMPVLLRSAAILMVFFTLIVFLWRKPLASSRG